MFRPHIYLCGASYIASHSPVPVGKVCPPVCTHRSMTSAYIREGETSDWWKAEWRREMKDCLSEEYKCSLRFRSYREKLKQSNGGMRTDWKTLPTPPPTPPPCLVSALPAPYYLLTRCLPSLPLRFVTAGRLSVGSVSVNGRRLSPLVSLGLSSPPPYSKCHLPSVSSPPPSPFGSAGLGCHNCKELAGGVIQVYIDMYKTKSYVTN